MKICQMNLGADALYFPKRDLVVVHPDLSYGKAIGAVMGTVPNMSLALATELVASVAPTKVVKRGKARAYALGSLLTASIVFATPAHGGAPQWVDDRPAEDAVLACVP